MRSSRNVGKMVTRDLREWLAIRLKDARPPLHSTPSGTDELNYRQPSEQTWHSEQQAGRKRVALGWILDSTSKEGGELGWQSRKGAVQP